MKRILLYGICFFVLFCSFQKGHAALGACPTGDSPSALLGDQNSGPEEELARAGYPKDVPLSQAVKEFNRRARRDKVGKKQPELTIREVVAAIRCWNRDVDTIGDSAFQVFQSIAQAKTMPRGSYIRFIPGVIALNGYDVDVWWIDLQVGLDKYPTDMADVPMYLRRIRTVYVDSKKH